MSPPPVINDDPKVGFYVTNEKEMKTVSWIMETFLKYGSHQKTLEELRALGIKNKNGRDFKKNSLLTLLTNQFKRSRLALSMLSPAL